jgi:hypothetical protein
MVTENRPQRKEKVKEGDSMTVPPSLTCPRQSATKNRSSFPE